MQIAVYCGSSHGALPDYAARARQLGRSIAEGGHGLIYGGGDIGLMGEVADAVQSSGGTVIGVITEHLLTREIGNGSVDELIVVEDMPTRKRIMFERADAFVALPGGVGTMEELFEVLCWRYLGLHPKPVGLLNVAGFYDGLLAYLARAAEDGFIRDDHLVVAEDPDVLLDAIVAPG